jgi:hypothetical protein
MFIVSKLSNTETKILFFVYVFNNLETKIK